MSEWPVEREIRRRIEAIERNQALRDEESFVARAEALDELECHILDCLDRLLGAENPTAGLRPWREQATSLQRRLESVNERLWLRLRREIRAGQHTPAGLRRMCERYLTPLSTGEEQDGVSYDCLDVFVNGLLSHGQAPAETRQREPEMVFYQPTPARIVLEMIDRANITAADVFCDLGSGLGQVCLLVALLTGARALGIEFEPAYCAYAAEGARQLNLGGVHFLHADARAADLGSGTVFHLYTPFQGGMLREVLARLRREAQERTIRICSYGPCTRDLAREPWLQWIGQEHARDHRLAVFTSRPVGL